MDKKSEKELNYRNINEDFWFLTHNGYSGVAAIRAIDIAYKDVSYDIVVRELSLTPI